MCWSSPLMQNQKRLYFADFWSELFIVLGLFLFVYRLSCKLFLSEVNNQLKMCSNVYSLIYRPKCWQELHMSISIYLEIWNAG